MRRMSRISITLINISTTRIECSSYRTMNGESCSIIRHKTKILAALFATHLLAPLPLFFFRFGAMAPFYQSTVPQTAALVHRI